MGFMKFLKRVFNGGRMPKEKRRSPNIVLISSPPIQENEFISRRKEFPSVDPIAATTEDVNVPLPKECKNLQTPVLQHSDESDTTEEKSTEDQEVDQSDLNRRPAAVLAEASRAVHPIQDLSGDGDAAALLAKYQSEKANITLERNDLMIQVMKLQDDLSKSKEDFVLLAALYLTSKETFELETHIHEEEMTDLNNELLDCRMKISQMELEAQQSRIVSSSIATTPVGTQTEVTDEDNTTAMTEFTHIHPAEPVAPLLSVELSVHDVADSPTSSLVISKGVAADVDCLQLTQDYLIYDLSNVPTGLRRKVTRGPIRKAITDGRYEERKEHMMNQLWLENRLLQVETERDWIIEEKLSMEKTVAEKADLVIQYVSQLHSEYEALSGYLESETERADTAVKQAEEENALRIQVHEQFRRLRLDHEEISNELKSTQIDLDESQSIITDLRLQIEHLRLSTHANKHSSTVPFDFVTPNTPVPLHDERLEDNPPESLFIIRDEVVKTHLGHTVQLTNIQGIHFGRILGRGGQNVNKLKEKYKVNIKVSSPIDTPDQIRVVISSGSAIDRNSAAEEIIEDLPVDVAVFFRTSRNVKKRAQNSCPFVTVQDIGQGNFLLSGKLRECRKVYEELN